MRSPWRVETSAGCIHAPSATWQQSRSAHRDVAAALFDRVRADTRPVHVRMREAYARGASWDDVATEFGYATGHTAKTSLLRMERGAARA